VRAEQAASTALQSTAKEGRSIYYERSGAVKAYVLARAGGICECCKQPARYSRADGSPYLESHHMHRISDGGPDHPNWVEGICPNCHRRIHHGKDGDQLNRELQAYVNAIDAKVEVEATSS
jgi:5-methylcytosine-specific restriction protein A